MFQIQSFEDHLRSSATYQTSVVNIFGRKGIGKTSLLRTCNPATTLYVPVEAGDRGITDVPCARLTPLQTYADVADFVCWATGTHPGAERGKHFSEEHRQALLNRYGDPREALGQYKIIVLDTFSKINSMCFDWAEQDFSNPKDTWGVYRHLAGELERLMEVQHLKRWQNWVNLGHIVSKEIKQPDGTMISRTELDFLGNATEGRVKKIFDNIVVMHEMLCSDGAHERFLVCKDVNPWGLPASDRIGNLNMIEPAALEALIDKLNDHRAKIAYAGTNMERVLATLNGAAKPAQPRPAGFGFAAARG